MHHISLNNQWFGKMSSANLQAGYTYTELSEPLETIPQRVLLGYDSTIRAAQE